MVKHEKYLLNRNIDFWQGSPIINNQWNDMWFHCAETRRSTA